MSDNAFINAYQVARRKKHGAGSATKRQAVMLGIMAQFVSWRSPRWMIWPMRAASYIFYSTPN